MSPSLVDFDYVFGVQRAFNETAYSSAYVEVVGMDVVIQLLFGIFVLVLIQFPLLFYLSRIKRGA